MRGMLHVRVKRGLILELHDAAERVALPSRRNVRPYVGLQESGDLPLESSDVFGGSFLLGLRCIGLPAKGEYVKHVARRVFLSSNPGLAGRSECGNRGCDAAVAD